MNPSFQKPIQQTLIELNRKTPQFFLNWLPNHSLWQRLAPALYGYRWRFMVVIGLLGVATICAMMLPYLIKVGIDSYLVPAFETKVLEPHYVPLMWVGMLAMTAVVLGYMAEAAYVMLMQTTGQQMLNLLRKVVYFHTLRLPRSYFDNHPIGGLLTRVTSDIETLDESLNNNVLHMFTEVLKGIAFLSMMFYLNWKLALIVVVMLPALAVMIRFFQVRIRVIYYKARQALAEATGYLQECLNGMKLVQLLSMENYIVNQYKAKNHKFYQAQNISNIYDAVLYSLVEGITFLVLAVILWVAAGDLLTGVLTVGVLVAFIEYIQKLFIPIREFSQQLAIVQRSIAALSHIEEVCRVPMDEAEDKVLTKASSTNDALLPLQSDEHFNPLFAAASDVEKFEFLEFKDVSFAYSAKGEKILKGVSFRLEAGQTMAIVGATGSGKTTIIRLLQRAYEGYEGSILLNGRELSQYDADQLYRMIAVVHQEIFLFKENILFNIGMDRAYLSEKDIVQSAHYTCANYFIEELPEQYHFQVSSAGGNLSLGQNQLLCFARAVASNSQLVVLDEATSSVDSQTERYIQQAISNLHKNKTVIAIAHRLGTIRHAECILVMEQGQIMEQGNHAELVAKKGLYTRLVSEMET